MKAEARKVQPVGTLKKTLRILEVICDSPKGLRLKEISQKTGVNKSTAYRLLVHLEREGYLVRSGSQTYVLGSKFVEMAARGNWTEGLRSRAWPFLLELQRTVLETVNLAVLDLDSVLYVDVLESPHAFRLVSTPGVKRPLHCTGLGKALLAFLPAADQERLLSAMTFEKMTPRTVTSVVRLRKDLAHIRECGYAIDDEETVIGARCVAAPILDSKQRAIAAISISGPISRISQTRILEITKAVRHTAAMISEAIVSHNPPPGQLH
jgi:DNA-binding IclR family transcriptional regulator